MRANRGVLQNTLTSTIDNLGVQEESLGSANSRIQDTDVAQASAELTRNTILLNASTPTPSQPNGINLLALQLIG